MSFMENQVLGYQSPLYGRRTGQFKIESLNYKETAVYNSIITAIAKGGFTEGLKEAAVRGEVNLITLDDMYS